VVILGSILMLHSQASLVILLKIKTSVVAKLSILLYHLVCWLGFKCSKVQTKEKRNMGGKTTISMTIEIMYQQSQIYTYLLVALLIVLGVFNLHH